MVRVTGDEDGLWLTLVFAVVVTVFAFVCV